MKNFLCYVTFIVLLLVALSAAIETSAESSSVINVGGAGGSPAAATAPAVSNCTTMCRSFVYFGVGYSFKQIGPQTVAAWNVLSATTTTVSRVTVIQLIPTPFTHLLILL